MNTKDLRWFREVVRCKSISAAASHLYISQQGLSRSISNLEQQLKVPLLIRTSAGVEPTPYGKFLYERSASLLLEWDAMTVELERMSQMERGYLRLCSAYGILRILSPDFILDFQKTFPNINIDYMEFPDLQVDVEMEQGNFDVAFHIGEEHPEHFQSTPLFTSDISLLVYEDHPLAGSSSVSVQDIKGEPMIVESRAFQIHRMLRRSCNDYGFEPNIIYHTSGFSLCHKLCQQKRGISVVVDRISRDMTNSGLLKIPFEEKIEWKAFMLYREEFADNPMIRRFHEYTMDYMSAHQID